MSQMTPQGRFFRHTQLKLRSFYSRITYSPWKPVILFCGDPDFIPYYQADKKLFIIELGEKARSPCEYGFHLHLDSVSELPFADGSVDTLVCYWNKRFPDPAVFHEFHRVLSPQGKLVVTANNRHSLYYGLRSRGESDTLWSIESWLSLYDFLVLKAFPHSFAPPGSSKILMNLILGQQKRLEKYLPRWANQYSWVCVKNTEHYQPLPSYLRLSQRLPLSSLLSPA